MRCYRHPDRETYVSCSECGRGICPDCMTYGPVGIRCPDHATTGGRAAAPRRAARSASRSLSAYGPFVTFILIGVNVALFVLELATGGQLNGTGSWIYEKGVLVTQAVDSSGQVVGVSEGEWWRLLTATFLHYGPLHLGMNMLVLWFIGPALEEYFGHGRYLLVYLVSGLAGSAGALIWSPNSLTVGASGAIWGLMGAALILEARRICGHIGGLIGGGLCALAFSSFRRSPAIATMSMLAVGVVSVGLAAAQVA